MGNELIFKKITEISAKKHFNNGIIPFWTSKFIALKRLKRKFDQTLLRITDQWNWKKFLERNDENFHENKTIATK